MRNITKYLIICSLAVIPACKQQSLEAIYTTQEGRIDSFISSQTRSNPDMRVVHNNGANRLVLTEGEGEELSSGGTVSFYCAGYTFSSSAPAAGSLFYTNRQELADSYGWAVSEGDFSVMTVSLDDEDALVPGLRDGLVGVKAGEICYIVFSGKYGFGNKPVGMIPANSALLYHIWVESINNE